MILIMADLQAEEFASINANATAVATLAGNTTVVDSPAAIATDQPSHAESKKESYTVNIVTALTTVLSGIT